MMKMRPCMWMKRTSSFTPRLSLFRSFSLASCVTLSLASYMTFSLALTACVLPLAAPSAAFAQKNVPQERIAEGKVVDKTDNPIGGAVVYLKNSRSSAVKTYIADENGHFRFGELAQDTDYEIWAESNSVRSKSREISSFDNENKFYFTLKVNTVKPVSLDGPSISSYGLTPNPKT